MAALKLTHANVPVVGSNFGKLIVELKFAVGLSVKLCTSESGVTPFAQEHWARAEIDATRPEPSTIQIMYGCFFIGTDFKPGQESLTKLGTHLLGSKVYVP